MTRISDERLEYILWREDAMAVEHMSESARNYSRGVKDALRELQSARAEIKEQAERIERLEREVSKLDDTLWSIT